jgi:hypothetical protein
MDFHFNKPEGGDGVLDFHPGRLEYRGAPGLVLGTSFWRGKTASRRGASTRVSASSSSTAATPETASKRAASSRRCSSMAPAS